MTDTFEDVYKQGVEDGFAEGVALVTDYLNGLEAWSNGENGSKIKPLIQIIRRRIEGLFVARDADYPEPPKEAEILAFRRPPAGATAAAISSVNSSDRRSVKPGSPS
jgi:hypothetical protein